MENLDVVRVKDRGVELEIDFDTCVLYHGRDSIGGLALGFRLMQWALARLSPNAAPERSTITFKTAFPGPGLRDAVELISRAYTSGRYEVLQEAPQSAPEGVYGHLYFEISVGDETVKVSLVPGAVSEDFIQTGRATKMPGVTAETLAHWTQLKEALAVTVMSVNIEDILQIH